MQLVVDANIIMAALIKGEFTLDLMYFEELELLSPEYLFTEIEKHKNKILKRSGISKEDLSIFINIIKSRIKIIPSEESKSFINEAKSISPDPNDVPYFALALKYNASIWSNDKALKKQPKVKILSTQELLKLL